MASVTITNAAGRQQPNYPENQWWVAATPTDLGDRPMPCLIRGLPVVLDRHRNGAAVALDERGPAPLEDDHRPTVAAV